MEGKTVTRMVKGKLAMESVTQIKEHSPIKDKNYYLF